MHLIRIPRWLDHSNDTRCNDMVNSSPTPPWEVLVSVEKKRFSYNSTLMWEEDMGRKILVLVIWSSCPVLKNALNNFLNYFVQDSRCVFICQPLCAHLSSKVMSMKYSLSVIFFFNWTGCQCGSSGSCFPSENVGHVKTDRKVGMYSFCVGQGYFWVESSVLHIFISR